MSAEYFFLSPCAAHPCPLFRASLSRACKSECCCITTCAARLRATSVLFSAALVGGQSGGASVDLQQLSCLPEGHWLPRTAPMALKGAWIHSRSTSATVAVAAFQLLALLLPHVSRAFGGERGSVRLIRGELVQVRGGRGHLLMAVVQVEGVGVEAVGAMLRMVLMWEIYPPLGAISVRTFVLPHMLYSFYSTVLFHSLLAAATAADVSSLHGSCPETVSLPRS